MKAAGLAPYVAYPRRRTAARQSAATRKARPGAAAQEGTYVPGSPSLVPAELP